MLEEEDEEERKKHARTTTTTMGCFRISAARHYEAFSKVSTSRTKDSLTPPSLGCFIYSFRSGSAKRRQKKKKASASVFEKRKKEREREENKGEKEECASPDGIDSSAVKVSWHGWVGGAVFFLLSG